MLLTTQYLEEADRLSDKITMIDDGRVISEGTAEELKARSGGAVLQLRVADRRETAEAADVIAGLGSERPKTAPELGEVTMPVADGASLLAEIVRRLDSAGIAISDIGLRQPTLDDVFLALTGRTTEVSEVYKDGAPDTAIGRRGRRMNRSAP